MPAGVSIPVRTPSVREDQPRAAVLAAIFVVCAGAGLGLARWGTYGTAAGSGAGTGSGSGSGSGTGSGAGSGAEPGSGTGSGAATEPAAGPTDTIDSPRAAGDAIVPVPGTAPVAVPDPVPGSAPVPGSVPDPDPDPDPDPVPVPVRAPAGFARGRVAYLRCEGVPQRAGPVPCPRDEALELAAWAAIEGAAGCEALAGLRGQADVVVDYASGRPTEIRARDTFGADVARLDGARVVECLAPALAAVPQTMGSTRLVVSFRFSIRR